MSKTVLVTGAASGIGLSIANKYISEGYMVIGVDKNDTKVDFPIFRCDISNEAEIKETFKLIEKEYPFINYLINAAGVFYKGSRNYIGKIVVNDFKDTLNVNLTGTMLCIQNALPLIRKANGDKAILSISSDQAEYPQFQNAAYAASKAGINSVTRSTARELLKEKIRANALEASTVKTNFINELGGTKENIEEIFDEENEKLPLGLIPVDEIAEFSYFLCSPKSSHITGQTFLIDSGLYSKVN